MTENNDTTLAKLSPEGETVLALREYSKLFAREYAKDLEKYSQQIPTLEEFEQIVNGIAEDTETKGSEEIAFALSSIMQQTASDRDGIFDRDERTEFPELRIFHGAGKDPNRPAKQIPGTLYMNTCEDVGEKFVGAVIAIWKGRTMWGNKDAGESTAAPICASMNRLVGSTFGTCSACPERPWRGGQQTRCNDDIVAFMLTEKMDRLVLVRFAKTSEPAGRRLLKLLKLCSSSWTKWFELSLETKSNDKNQWFVMKVQPAGVAPEVFTPKIIHPFCKALMNNLSGSFILPGIARTYAQSAEAVKETEGEPSGGSAETVTINDVTGDGKNDEENYGVMPEAGKDDDAPNV